MSTLKNFFIQPFTEKGIVWGTIDAIIKLATAFVWIYLFGILASLLWQSLVMDYDPFTQLWWLAYCFLILFGASLLTYIIFFVREYPQEDDEEETPAE